MIYTQPMALHSRYPTAFGSIASARSRLQYSQLDQAALAAMGSRLRPNAVRSLVRDFRWHSSASPAFAPWAGPNAGLLKLRINRFRKFSTAIIVRLELLLQVFWASFGAVCAAQPLRQRSIADITFSWRRRPHRCWRRRRRDCRRASWRRSVLRR